MERLSRAKDVPEALEAVRKLGKSRIAPVLPCVVLATVICGPGGHMFVGDGVIRAYEAARDGSRSTAELQSIFWACIKKPHVSDEELLHELHQYLVGHYKRRIGRSPAANLLLQRLLRSML